MTETLLDTQDRAHYRELLLADRCDQCPNGCSQAFVRVVKVINKKEYELLFCGHHFHDNEPVLVVDGWLIQDERNKINSKPQSGSKYEDSDV